MNSASTPRSLASRPAPDDAPGMMARARLRDPRGDQAQVALVAATLFMLPLGTAPLAIMTGIAIGYSLLRLWATGPAVGYLIRLPIIWVLLAMLAWTMASMAWTSNRPDGWDEASILRFQIPFLIAIWPVIDRWRLFVWALACGVALAAFIQIGQWALGESWPMFFWWHAERILGRYPGLVHPNSTAVVAVASILLLPRLLLEQRRFRPLALALWVLAWVGLVLTGSRGGWIAAVAGLIASIPRLCRAWMAMKRVHNKRSSWRAGWIVGVAAVFVSIGLGLAFGSQISTRIRSAVADLQAAREQGDYSGDVAARWRQIEISFALVREHPLTGVGVGGYLEAARQYVKSRPGQAIPESPDDRPSEHHSSGLLTHPHSALLYHLAILGCPGLVLYLAMWLLLSVEAGRTRLRGFDLNRLPLVLGLFVAFLVDSNNMSAPGTLALMFVIALVYYETRPPSSWMPAGDGPAPACNNEDAGVDHA